MFLDQDGTPFQSGHERMETRDTEDLAIVALCQREEVFELRPVHSSLIPRARMRVISLVDASLAWKDNRRRKDDIQKLIMDKLLLRINSIPTAR